MPAVHSNLVFVNTRRVRGLVPAVDNDEPLRKGEAGSGGGGEDGASAYEIAVANGFVGTEIEWLASLQGAPGANGSNGADGLDGTDGVDGAPGEDGGPGPAGRDFYNRRIQTVVNATGGVTCNWALYDEIRLTLIGNVTLDFTGANDGQGCTLRIKQDATGSRTVTFDGDVRFSADITGYVATVTANKADRLGFIRDSGDDKYDFVSVIKGF